MSRLVVTGSEGVLGRVLVAGLRRRGHEVLGLDLRARDPVDVRDPAALAPRLRDADGVVHLAAVSRVAHAERAPELCHHTNVGATHAVLDACAAQGHAPWVLLASSREVYGRPTHLPVTERHPLAPINTYGRSKLAAERALEASPLRTLAVRLSNLYGAPHDHPDRLVPAWMSAATTGRPLRLRGPDHTLDLVHIADAVDGLHRAIAALDHGETLPTLQLTSGRPTTLRALARLVLSLTRSRSPIHHEPPGPHEVPHFVGDPTLAYRVLGWRPRRRLESGLAALAPAPHGGGPWAS